MLHLLLCRVCALSILLQQLSAVKSATCYINTSLRRFKQILRYGLLCHKLIYMQARYEHDLAPLVEEGLLTEDEFELLDGRPAKAMIAWSWCVGFQVPAY